MELPRAPVVCLVQKDKLTKILKKTIFFSELILSVKTKIVSKIKK